MRAYVRVHLVLSFALYLGHTLIKYHSVSSLITPLLTIASKNV